MQTQMKIIIYTFIFLFISFLSLSAAENQLVDSLEQERIPDSLLSVPLISHGKIFQGDYKPFRVINKRDIQLINYVGVNDILSNFTPFYSQHLGGYSTYNSFFALGANSKSISWAFNGRNINDMDLGSFNPEQFPTEFFENIEIFTGSDAVILGDNAASVFINFQEIRYNTAIPFTRIWFGNSGFGYLGADAIFSQNIMPNWNFTLGFRSYNSAGAYENGWGDNWNARAILRWNPDNSTSISFTENFSNIGSGTSGGINTDISTNIFDELSAIPNFSGLNERVFRHDLTLSATHKFDTIQTNAASVNLYLSNVRWDRSSGQNILFNTADTNNRIFYNSYSYMGAEGKYEITPFEAISFRFGAYSEVDLIDKTYFYDDFNGVSSSAYAHSTINFSDNFNLSGGVRISSKFGNVGLSYGAKQSTLISNNLKFTADFSYSDRLPYPVEGLQLNSEQHIAITSEIIYQLTDNSHILTGAYLRSIFSPILAEIDDDPLTLPFLNYYSGENLTRMGAYIEYSSDLIYDFTFKLKGLTQITVNDNGNRVGDLPIISANFRAFYTYKPGRSMLRVGVETGVLTDFTGDRFFPLTRSYYPGNYDSGLMTTGLTAFLEVKLGDAYVKIQYDNILNQNYYYVAVNPMFPANLRLTANWTFNEN